MHISTESWFKWVTLQTQLANYGNELVWSKFNSFLFVSLDLYCFCLDSDELCVYQHGQMWNTAQIIIYCRRIGLMLIKTYSTFGTLWRHSSEGTWNRLSTSHSLSLWKTKSKSTPRRLPSIHPASERAGRRSQVIQGLIKALMIHTARCNVPSSSNWLDTPARSGAYWLTPRSKRRKKAAGTRPASRSDIYLRWTVCCESRSMSTERRTSGLQSHQRGGYSLKGQKYIINKW